MSSVIQDCVDEMTRLADPTPLVTAAVRARRRIRAEELDEVHAVVDRGGFYTMGYRSATDWLVVTTKEGVGHCKSTLTLAERIRHMPLIKATFAIGDLAESSLRLLCETWHCDIADVFSRDEQMLCSWATTLPHRDFKMILDTWRMRADPNREERTAQDKFDDRALHLSSLLDGMGRLDGTLDPEGFALVREAIRAYAQPAEGETRTAAKRRADALVTIAKLALEQFVPKPGQKRRKPKVVATINYDDLLADFLDNLDDAAGDDAADEEAGRVDIHDPIGTTGEPTGPTQPTKPESPDTPRPSGATECTPPDSPRPSGLGGSLDTDYDRIIVPPETIRRMACDCNLHRYITNPLGTVMDYGRTQRIVSDSQFDTLLIRDHGCRWPGCGIPAGGCDAHHAVHWLNDGETEPDNLVLLCWFHHKLLHEQHWSIEPLGGGHFTLHDPHGGSQYLRPPLVGVGLPTQPPLPGTNG